MTITNINKVFSDNRLSVSVNDMDSIGSMVVIIYDVDGDWKHEHLRSNWILNEYMTSLGYETIKNAEKVTYDDGSDCYEATHYSYYRKVA